MTQSEIFARVASTLTEYLRLDQGEVTAQSHIINDLGADSLAMVELGFQFSEAFQIGMITPTEENMILQNLVEHIEREMGQGA